MADAAALEMSVVGDACSPPSLFVALGEGSDLLLDLLEGLDPLAEDALARLA